MKNLMLIFFVLFFFKFSFCQSISDTLEVDIAKITNSNRIIILQDGFNVPSLEYRPYKNITESCVSAINCTVRLFEYFDTYDNSKLILAGNLLQISKASLQNSRYHKETSETDASIIQTDILDYLSRFISTIETTNEKSTDRNFVAKIQGKYFHVSKNPDLTILIANLMIQVKAQTKFDYYIKLK